MTKTNYPLASHKHLLVIIALFAAPYLAAHFFYSHRHLIKQVGTTQHGQLINPPLDMSKLDLTDRNGIAFNQKALRGKWLLLYLNPGVCSDACQKNLYYMRQINSAMGKDASRIHRIVLTLTTHRHDAALQELLQNKFRQTQHLLVDNHELANFLKDRPSNTVALTRGYLYFVDPYGNIMMGYAPDAKPSGQFKDLKHIVKISQIG